MNTQLEQLEQQLYARITELQETREHLQQTVDTQALTIQKLQCLADTHTLTTNLRDKYSMKLVSCTYSIPFAQYLDQDLLSVCESLYVMFDEDGEPVTYNVRVRVRRAL